MKTVDYVVTLDVAVRKRHHHSSEKGRVKSFVVQLELFIDDKWSPIVRYDCAHGFAHIDLYEPNKRPKKVPLNLDFNMALNLAEWDISNNWEKYVDDYKRKAQ